MSDDEFSIDDISFGDDEMPIDPERPCVYCTIECVLQVVRDRLGGHAA